jgi:hypothetical protein
MSQTDRHSDDAVRRRAHRGASLLSLLTAAFALGRSINTSARFIPPS